MSVERAQKSEIHEATDDATSSPANRTTPETRARGEGDFTGGAAGGAKADVGKAHDHDAARSPAATERGAGLLGNPGSPSDRAASPPSAFERGAALAGVRPDADNDPAVQGQIGAGPGASDGYSGGGPGSNNPDAETALRAGADTFAAGDAEEDRKKLFPEAAAADELRVKDDPDESSFGGPLRIDDPTSDTPG